MNGTIADLFGFLAIATTLSVFIQKNQTTLIIMKVIVNMLWAVYFFCAAIGELPHHIPHVQFKLWRYCGG